MAEADAVTITAIVGAATGLVSLVVMAMKIRQDEAEVETLQDLAKSLLGVVTTYDTEVARLRRDVEAFRTFLGPDGESLSMPVGHPEEIEIAAEREDAWRRMRQIAKALGWDRPGPRGDGGEE